MDKKLIGDKNQFAIEYSFFDDSHDTEIAMYIDGSNILEFIRNGNQYTTRWDFDELVFWLRKLIDNMVEDPYPVECDGEYAAQKDDDAREFDSDDEDEFETYYQRLEDWNLRHRWHTESSGAILADVYFQLVGENVEISWDNRMPEDGVVFKNEFGGARIPKELFYQVVDGFLKEYADHWFENTKIDELTRELFSRDAIEILDGGEETDTLYDSLVEKAEMMISEYGWDAVFESWKKYMYENCHTIKEAISFATWFESYGGHNHKIENPYEFLAYLYDILDLNPVKYDAQIMDDVSFGLLEAAGIKENLWMDDYYTTETDPELIKAVEALRKNKR